METLHQPACETPARAARLGKSRPSVRLRAGAGLAMVCLLTAGCSDGDLNTVYGMREGFGASSSVNGTGVLGEMVEDRGHTVFSWYLLSPRLRNRADCIVWFPDDFSPPDPSVRQWLEEWLEDAPSRTLIYVGRDFEAAALYWEAMLPLVPDQKNFYQSRLDRARESMRLHASRLSEETSCPWFTLRRQSEVRPVQSLRGEPAWTSGIDGEKLQIELRSRLELPAETKTLLESGDGEPLVGARAFGESRLVVVANGSFLLNASLVNHEHRKLAGRLLDECLSGRQTVVFLESGSGGPRIAENDPTLQVPSGLEFLNAWPLSWILLHFVALGAIFCFSRSRLLGPARQPPADRTSDFGKHVDALAELLAHSQNAAYARARLAQYDELIRGHERPAR